MIRVLLRVLSAIPRMPLFDLEWFDEMCKIEAEARSNPYRR